VSAPPEEFKVRSLALSAYLPSFLFSIGQGAAFPMLALLAIDMGLSVPMAGALVALRSGGQLLFDLPAATLVSRIGEYRAMIVGTVVLAVVAVGIGTRPPVPVLIVLVVMMGGAWAIWLLARVTYVAEVTPLNRRGRVMSIMGGSSRIGQFVGPLLASFFVAEFGISSAFFVQAAVAVIACAVMFLVPTVGGKQPRNGESSLKVVGAVIKEYRGVFATAGFATIAIQLVRSSKDAMIPLWGNHIGLAAPRIALIFGAMNAADTALFYPVGVVMDRFGRKWAGVPCLIMLSVGLVIIPFTGDFVALLLAALFIGLGNGLGAGINMTLGSDFSPPVRRAEFLGAWRLISDVGSAGGPLFVAALTSVASLAVASLFAAGFGLVGAGVLAWLVPETLLPPEAVLEDT
jgi:MFS family permease